MNQLILVVEGGGVRRELIIEVEFICYQSAPQTYIVDDNSDIVCSVIVRYDAREVNLPTKTQGCVASDDSVFISTVHTNQITYFSRRGIHMHYIVEEIGRHRVD